MFTSVTPHPVCPADDVQGSGLARFWHQLGPGSRKRHARARVESQWLAALRCQWQQACQHVGLGLTIHTPSGYTVSVPRIARADFGPPVSFTVQLRPGQRDADITAAGPRLASALGAAGLKVTNRDAGWVTIVLIDLQDECKNGSSDMRDGGAGNRPRLPELRVA
jgi:DNA segregation ATPase FtsK/SpoIIIE, S-DNA-T family